jgi:hypothetical protein
MTRATRHLLDAPTTLRYPSPSPTGTRRQGVLFEKEITMLRRLATLSVLSALIALAQVARAADDQPDPSSPKGVAAAFFKAMEAGDAATAKSLATGKDKQLAVIDLLVPVFHSFKELETAAVKKWGDEGRKALSQNQGGGPGTPDFNEQLKTAKEEINGDTATIIPANANVDKKDQLKLKKVDGKWKLDMASLPAEGIDDPAATKMLSAVAEVAKSTAAEIDQGKYASAKEAKEAMTKKLIPLITPPTPPAKTPPKKDEPKK